MLRENAFFVRGLQKAEIPAFLHLFYTHVYYSSFFGWFLFWSPADGDALPINFI
jgi:hypothetical protein